MGFESYCSEFPANGEGTFTFKKKVMKHVLGISRFDLKFAKGEHHNVKKLRISLGYHKLGDQFIVTTNATLDDDSRHHIAPESKINVSILAWVDGDYEALTLVNPPLPISNTANDSNPVRVYQLDRPVFRQTVLSGFDFSFPDDNDRELQQLTIAVGSNFNAATATVTPTVTAAMIGGHSKVATCYGDCGLVDLCEPKPVDWLHATSYNLSHGGTCRFDPATSGAHYIAFMTGFDIRYANGQYHKLREIEASVAVHSDGLTEVKATMEDNGKNRATTARVAGVTFAYTAPKPKPS